jgi:GTPase Era involved in 16S rRNA processing
MENNKLNVGIIGGFQNGKSTFVNCLLDGLVARTGGEGVSVTSVNTKYVYGDIQSVSYLSAGREQKKVTLSEFVETKTFPNGIDEIVVSLWKPILKTINIIDTPGFNAKQKDTAMAINSLKGLDVAIVVVNNRGLEKQGNENPAEKDIMKIMTQRHIPFFVLMNCTDTGGLRWLPKSQFNQDMFKKISADIQTEHLTPVSINKFPVWACNLKWFWYATENYRQEIKEKVEDIVSDIKYFKEEANRKYKEVIDEKYFLRESNFLPLRQFFDNDNCWGFPLSCIQWQAALDKTFNEWENNLRTVINKF